jgi:hypothetical protein
MTWLCRSLRWTATYRIKVLTCGRLHTTRSGTTRALARGKNGWNVRITTYIHHCVGMCVVSHPPYALISLRTCDLSHAKLPQSVYWLGYGLDDWGSIPGRGRERMFFSSPPRPDWLWVPPNFLSNGFRGSFPRGKAVGSWIWPLACV